MRVRIFRRRCIALRRLFRRSCTSHHRLRNLRRDEAHRRAFPARSQGPCAEPATIGKPRLAKSAGANKATSPEAGYPMHGMDVGRGSRLCSRPDRMVPAPALAHGTIALLHSAQHALQRNGSRRCCHCRSSGCTRVLLLGPPGQQDYFPAAHLGVRATLVGAICSTYRVSCRSFPSLNRGLAWVSVRNGCATF
jgi:hypothetical protein